MRTLTFICVLLTLLCLGCKRDNGSYMSFDDAGEEAQKAMATNVDFTLTEDIFQRWQRAQANLEQLPSSELESAADLGGPDPVERGIRRLESSPRARRAIESAGLSVKNFVLATVALAQAMKASQAGVPPTVGAIAQNVRFVRAHSSRMSGRGAASVWVPPIELSEEELAAQRAMEMDATISEEIATGAEQSEPTVPPLEDWSRNQPQVLTTPPDVPIPTEPTPKTDSLTSHVS